ncbi:MAG: hypothetical protein NT166_04165 [Candidatus Aminicenantes bacterium]|nr:hypothetical protein [Candidatus Aminicenantes bacterium]
MTMLIADKFTYSRKIYVTSFYRILSYIINAYALLIKNKEPLENNENSIRDILVEKYLNNHVKREQLGIENVIFNREVSENSGFVDIKVQTAIALNNPDAYYIFECKRLDGSNDLNKKYIQEGILRFTLGKYSAYYSLNGMLGFEVKKIDTPANMDKINRLAISEFKETNIIKGLTGIHITGDFKYSYISMHKTTSSKTIELYHLMLDISDAISMNRAQKLKG